VKTTFPGMYTWNICVCLRLCVYACMYVYCKGKTGQNFSPPVLNCPSNHVPKDHGTLLL
jgi:hypothetical protein